MKELFGDLWELAKGENKVLCITSNGFVKSNGECVMGRGIALEAAQRFPLLPHHLGRAILKYGNHVLYIGKYWETDPKNTYKLFSFPVKHHWKQFADPELIKRSAQELVEIFPDAYFKAHPDTNVYIPRPGCGNG